MLFRSQLAQNEPKVVQLEKNFKRLGVHIELIGADDDGTNAIKGFRGITQSISKYSISHTEKVYTSTKKRLEIQNLKKWK